MLELIFSVASATSDTRFGEVHDLERILAALASVTDSEIKPLLVPFCIGVDLHEQSILSCLSFLGL